MPLNPLIRLALLCLLVVPAILGGCQTERRSALGESCMRTSDCAEPAVCLDQVCLVPGEAPSTSNADDRPSYTSFKVVDARKPEEVEAALKEGWTLVNCGSKPGSRYNVRASSIAYSDYEHCYLLK